MRTLFPDLPAPTIEAFTASDGYRLHYRHWRPVGRPPRGRLVALHGIQSHSGWYGYSSGRLCAAGWEVWFLDRRGSGMNEPSRGHAPSSRRLLDDVAELLRLAASSGDGPLVLLGLSWSGKLAVVTAARPPVPLSGLALLYPGIKTLVRPTPFQNLQLSLAKRLGVVSRRVRIPLEDPALFTSDPVFQDQIRHDPLALHEVTVGFLLASRDLDREADVAPEHVACPVLMLLAGEDRIIDNPAKRQYAARFRSLSLIEYPSAAHTLEFEPCREQFVSDLEAWLNERK